MPKPTDHDIEVEISFVKTEDGGRKGPVRSGYRPQFYYNAHDWDAVHTYTTDDWVHPGEIVRGYLDFLSPEEHICKLFPGMKFVCREGSRVVAYGLVLRILALPASAERMREHRNNTSQNDCSSAEVGDHTTEKHQP